MNSGASEKPCLLPLLCSGRSPSTGLPAAWSSRPQYDTYLHDMRGETANGALLNGDHHGVLPRQPPQHVSVQGLAEAGVHDRCRHSRLQINLFKAWPCTPHGTTSARGVPRAT